MNEILVPTGLADLVDQMIILQGKTDAATDPVNRRILAQRLNLMQRIASRVLPQDPSFDDLRRAVVAARRDLMQLEADLCASEVRSDFGVAFVALARAYLQAQHDLDACKLALDTCAMQTMDSAEPVDISISGQS